MSIEDMMAADAADQADGVGMPTDEMLAQLTEMSNKVLEAEEWLEKTAEKQKKVEGYLRNLTDKLIPEKLKELGMSDYTLTNGYKIGYKTEVYVSLTEERKQAAFAWLRENKMDGIIKNEIIVGFTRGEDAAAIALAQKIADMGLRPEQKQNIHHMTLKAFVGEQMRKGTNIPLELFGAFIVDRATVEEPKKPKVKK